MDPDANLREQRQIARRIALRLDSERWDSQDVRDDNLEDGVRLAELVEALDGWISKGGFLPEAWVDRA